MEAQQISSTEEEAWYKRQIHEKYEVSKDSYYWGRERLPYLQLEILKIVKFGPPDGLVADWSAKPATIFSTFWAI